MNVKYYGYFPLYVPIMNTYLILDTSFNSMIAQLKINNAYAEAKLMNNLLIALQFH